MSFMDVVFLSSLASFTPHFSVEFYGADQTAMNLR